MIQKKKLKDVFNNFTVSKSLHYLTLSELKIKIISALDIVIIITYLLNILIKLFVYNNNNNNNITIIIIHTNY